MHQALVDRARKGDREAFDALARTVGDRCMAIAFRILRDADLAEDAVQGALITAWQQLRSLREPDRFEAWLHRILTHQCYAEARRNRRMRADVRVLPIQQADTGGLLSVNDRDELDRAFRRLTLEHEPFSSSTTTWACPSPRSPNASACPSERSSPGCITRRRQCGPAWMLIRAHRPSQRRGWHERHA